MGKAREAAGRPAEAAGTREAAVVDAEASGSRVARATVTAARAEALLRERKSREALALLDGATVEGLPPETEAEVRLVSLGALLEGSTDAGRIDAALESARRAVDGAGGGGGDPARAGRRRRGGGRRAAAAGAGAAAREAYRLAAAAAQAGGRAPGPHLLDALRGLERRAPDPAAAQAARLRLREAAEEMRARAGGA